MTHTYYFCKEGSIAIASVHAYVTKTSGAEKAHGTPAEHDRIVRRWCEHFCMTHEPHVLEVGDDGLATQVYKHLIYTKRKQCCAHYWDAVKASA